MIPCSECQRPPLKLWLPELPTQGARFAYLHQPLSVVLHDVLQHLQPLHRVVVVQGCVPLHGIGHVGAGGRAAAVCLRQQEGVAAGPVLDLVLLSASAVHTLPKAVVGCRQDEITAQSKENDLPHSLALGSKPPVHQTSRRMRVQSPQLPSKRQGCAAWPSPSVTACLFLPSSSRLGFRADFSPGTQ